MGFEDTYFINHTYLYNLHTYLQTPLTPDGGIPVVAEEEGDGRQTTPELLLGCTGLCCGGLRGVVGRPGK
jgi:hypothetical protein